MKETKQSSSEKEVPVIGVSESMLWGRLLDPVSNDLSPEADRYFLNLRFPQSDTDRMQALAEKAREGSLTLEEQIEMDNYEQVGQVLSLMKSKVRKSLKKLGATY